MTIRLPGLIDPHVHLRDPGQTEKEDFLTGTSAALAGGFTTLLDMPNNKRPITTIEALNEKMTIAKNKIVCDVGFYFGSTGDNLDEFERLQNYSSSEAQAESTLPAGRQGSNNETIEQLNNEKSSRPGSNNKLKVFGLKLYLNKTTGNYLIDKQRLTDIFKAWPKGSPILLHAIDETIDDIIHVLQIHPRPIHICHISSKYELSKVIQAKNEGLPITCGVTPHHLFLSENDLNHLSSFGIMQPPLRPRSDVDFLWKNLRVIDCIESDHAPHTLSEKQAEPVPFGVPGLETTLPLLLTAVSENKLRVEDIIRLCHTGPAKIFNIPHLPYHPNHPDTFIEIDPNITWEIKNENLFTKSKWSPFDGWRVKGKVKKVTLRGNIVFENDRVIANQGDGNVLIPS